MEFQVASVDEGRRLDRYLEKLEGGLPASLVRRLLRQRRVRVNGTRVRDGSLQLETGDTIEIHADLRRDQAPVDERRWTLDPLPVLYRDEDFLVVNKPAGVACSDDGTDQLAMQVWLREELAEEIAAGTARPEPCHRLDRGTTGIVVVALTPTAFDRFRRAQEAGQVRKVYELVVEGRPDWTAFECTQALTRAGHAGPTDPRMVAGDELDARTDFRVLRTEGSRALLEAVLHTGRTHQIRAHCRILGLPIVGDPRYGIAAPIGHQMLHAREVELQGAWRVTAPWPAREAEWLRDRGFGN